MSSVSKIDIVGELLQESANPDQEHTMHIAPVIEDDDHLRRAHTFAAELGSQFLDHQGKLAMTLKGYIESGGYGYGERLNRLRKIGLVARHGGEMLDAESVSPKPLKVITSVLGHRKDLKKDPERRMEAVKKALEYVKTEPSRDGFTAEVGEDEFMSRMHASLGSVPLRNCIYDADTLHQERKRFRAGFYASILLYATQKNPQNRDVMLSLRGLHIANNSFGQLHGRHVKTLVKANIDQAYIKPPERSQEDYLAPIERIKLVLPEAART